MIDDLDKYLRPNTKAVMRVNEIASIECVGAGPRRVIIMSVEYSEIVVWPVIATSLHIGLNLPNICHIFFPFHPTRDV